MVIRMHQFAEPGTLADLRGNEPAAARAAMYRDAADREKRASEDKQTARAELLDLLGDREKAILDGYTISAGMVGPAEIPAYTRPGYRNFRLTAKKVKA